jgi:hypothetical protein|nr:MAG TPA: hypothetical protein [Caudoviricetes sp.]
MMNTYSEAVLDIPYKKETDRQLNDFQLQYSICKAIPSKHLGFVYNSPLKRLGLPDVWQVDNYGIKTVNTVSNAPTHTVGLAVGSEDVDYVYAMYLDHPEWFEGSSEAAFKNTDAVINLALNHMGKDYYSLFKKAYQDGYTNKHVWGMIRDILVDVGIKANADDKPMFPLAYHLEVMKDYITDKFNRRFGDGSLSSKKEQFFYEGISSTDFSKYVFGQSGDENTINFIRQCLVKGGVGLLITYLNAMYGSLIIRKEV